VRIYEELMEIWPNEVCDTLINEVIDKLKDTKYFNKLDLIWEYNNIWIKEGDKWKAAFLTNKGLFEPKVIYFGLYNLLGTFQ